MKILLSVFAVAVMLVLTSKSVMARQPAQICNENGCSSWGTSWNYGSWDVYRRPSNRVDPWSRSYRPSSNYQRSGYPAPIYSGGYLGSGYRGAYRGYDYRRSECRPHYYRY